MVFSLSLFDIGNILFLLGTSKLIWTLYKDRNILKGFDLFGSIITLLAILCVNTGFLISGMISWIFSIPTIIYWAMISLFLIRKKLSF